MTEQEARHLWQDAYLIAWVGATNPVAVALTIAQHAAAIGAVSLRDTALDTNCAMRAMTGHLAQLMGGTGPSDDDLKVVKAACIGYGILTADTLNGTEVTVMTP